MSLGSAEVARLIRIEQKLDRLLQMMELDEGGSRAARTNENRIIAVLLQNPGLDDDELSRLSDVMPRQQVNQICRLLESQGRLIRERGPRGKIVNKLVD